METIKDRADALSDCRQSLSLGSWEKCKVCGDLDARFDFAVGPHRNPHMVSYAAVVGRQ